MKMAPTMLALFLFVFQLLSPAVRADPPMQLDVGVDREDLSQLMSEIRVEASQAGDFAKQVIRYTFDKDVPYKQCEPYYRVNESGFTRRIQSENFCGVEVLQTLDTASNAIEVTGVLDVFHENRQEKKAKELLDRVARRAILAQEQVEDVVNAIISCLEANPRQEDSECRLRIQDREVNLDPELITEENKTLNHDLRLSRSISQADDRCLRYPGMGRKSIRAGEERVNIRECNNLNLRVTTNNNLRRDENYIIDTLNSDEFNSCFPEEKRESFNELQVERSNAFESYFRSLEPNYYGPRIRDPNLRRYEYARRFKEIFTSEEIQECLIEPLEREADELRERLASDTNPCTSIQRNGDRSYPALLEDFNCDEIEDWSDERVLEDRRLALGSRCVHSPAPDERVADRLINDAFQLPRTYQSIQDPSIGRRFQKIRCEFQYENVERNGRRVEESSTDTDLTLIDQEDVEEFRDEYKRKSQELAMAQPQLNFITNDNPSRLEIASAYREMLKSIRERKRNLQCLTRTEEDDHEDCPAGLTQFWQCVNPGNIFHQLGGEASSGFGNGCDGLGQLLRAESFIDLELEQMNEQDRQEACFGLIDALNFRERTVPFALGGLIVGGLVLTAIVSQGATVPVSVKLLTATGAIATSIGGESALSNLDLQNLENITAACMTSTSSVPGLDDDLVIDSSGGLCTPESLSSARGSTTDNMLTLKQAMAVAFVGLDIFDVAAFTALGARRISSEAISEASGRETLGEVSSPSPISIESDPITRPSRGDVTTKDINNGNDLPPDINLLTTSLSDSVVRSADSIYQTRKSYVDYLREVIPQFTKVTDDMAWSRIAGGDSRFIEILTRNGLSKENLVPIFRVINDPELMWRYLQELEDEALALLRAEGKELTPENLRAAILDVLQSYEQRHGFELPKEVKSFLTTKEFLDIIASGKPLMDSALGNAAHGDIVHRLQWFALMKYLDETPGDPFKLANIEGINNLGDLYKLIGKVSREQDKKNLGNLWENLFDVHYRDFGSGNINSAPQMFSEIYKDYFPWVKPTTSSP